MCVKLLLQLFSSGFRLFLFHVFKYLFLNINPIEKVKLLYLSVYRFCLETPVFSSSAKKNSNSLYYYKGYRTNSRCPRTQYVDRSLWESASSQQIPSTCP